MNLTTLGLYNIQGLTKLIPKRELSFTVHLCEHCNLNCVGCNNFSPLSEESFADIEVFEKDLCRLSELSNGYAYRIQLAGGEPLLNPRAIDFAIIARKYFPHAKIVFVTNGLLLNSMPNNFYKSCSEYGIGIDLTRYPIDIDYEGIKKLMKENNISFHHKSNIKHKLRMRHEPLNLEVNESQSPSTINWLHCYMANNCIQLTNGNMSCTKVACIKHLKNTFQEETKNIYINPLDSINIYKVNSIEEIFDFFSKPFPFCKYCKTRDIKEIDWTKSNKSLEEWT